MNKDTKLIFEMYENAVKTPIDISNLNAFKVEPRESSGYAIHYADKPRDNYFIALLDYNKKVLSIRRYYPNGGWSPVPQDDPLYAPLSKRAEYDTKQHWLDQMGQ